MTAFAIVDLDFPDIRSGSDAPKLSCFGPGSLGEEQGLAQFFQVAFDAILELDSRFRIVRANWSAARLLRAPPGSLLQRDFASFLASTSTSRLRAIAQQLPSSTNHSAWVPRGLDVVRRDGWQFAAEATVSYYEVAGESFYAIVLRAAQELLAADDAWQALEPDSPLAENDGLPVLAEMIGQSRPLGEVKAAILQVAATPATVLITGETGTGKELVARAIHSSSRRAGKPFVRVNCAAVPATLCESEFFGHEKGAFTGAVTSRLGRFELAEGGTIFLDEIGDLPLELQPKLLRLLQEHEYERVGSSRTRKLDVRVIAATNRDLAAEMTAGRFREDLFYRLNVFPIAVPALRDRGSDVERLAQLFIDRFSVALQKPRPELTPDCRRRLRAYHWPGNVRELENVMERAVISASANEELTLRNLLPVDTVKPLLEARRAAAKSAPHTKLELRELERDNLVRALEQTSWKVAGPQGAASALGVPPSTLTSRMRALQILRPRREQLSPLSTHSDAPPLGSGDSSQLLDTPFACTAQ